MHVTTLRGKDGMSIEITKLTSCEGCASYVSQKGCEALMVLDSDDHFAVGVITKCPCITCLVKSMCGHSCETFSKVRKEKMKKWRSENNNNNTRTL